MRLISILFAGLVVAACHTSPPPLPVVAPQEAASEVAAPDPLMARLALEETRAAAREEIAARGHEALPLLLESLRQQSGHVRWEIVNLLGGIGDVRALGPLAEVAVLESDPHIRWRSLWALSRVGPAPEVVAALRPRLQDESAAVRWNTALALSFFDSADGLAVVHEGLLHPDPFRRFEAINALGRVHDARSVELLGTVLRSPSVRDRNEAVLALGRIGGTAARELLVSALMDESADVRWRAAMGLAKAGTRSELVALRIVAGTDISNDVREHARKAMNRIEQRGDSDRR